MNIDVTVMGLSKQWANGAIAGSQIRTWSEKFDDVEVTERDGKLTIYRSIDGVGGGPYGNHVVAGEAIASFAPSVWHSWRQVKD